MLGPWQMFWRDSTTTYVLQRVNDISPINDADTGMRGESAHRSDASNSPINQRILAEAGTAPL